ncbi:LETM1 domain-containing protein 1 isoform X1 [Anas platyrhynchos]|uniref:LETM1 domain-containing protein 1 isoform X1 n=1 Tax=Anas platyrhynchos TaxID=8839 RepID=UPI003AF25E6B
MAAPSGHFRRRSRDRSAHRLPPRHVGGRQDGAEPGGGPRGSLEARPRAQPRLGPPGAATPAGGAEGLRSLPFRRGGFPGRPGGRAAGPEAAQRALRALPAALLPPLLRPLRPLHRRWGHGVRSVLLEVREVRRIRQDMARQRLSPQQLPYRDMERLRQFRRDVLKAIPVGLLAIPPFANFLVIVLMYFFPRQLLIRYFWTPSQQREFLAAYHAIRSAAYTEVLQSLALAASSLPEPRLQTQLQELCTKVQRGAQPQVAELYALRSLFSGPPLGLSKLHASHVRALSRVLFLTPRLPAFVLRHRLRGHVLEIRHLDRALLRLGLGQLSEEELRAACYLRGLNSTQLGLAECRAWLEQWLQLSCKLQVSEVSLLANSMVLLSLNYLRAKE